MISGVLSSPHFRSLVAAWTQEERVTFVQRILEGPGLNNGDSRWGPLLQIQLADIMRDLIDPQYVADLVGQASAQAGVISPVGALRTAASDAHIDAFPPHTWSRVPVSATWDCSCQQCSAWRSYLNLPELSQTRLVLSFHCDGTAGSTGTRTVQLTDSDADSTVHISLAGDVSESAVAYLLEAIGRASGRAHGFETVTGVEARAIAMIRRFRAFQCTQWIEAKIRLIRRRSLSREGDSDELEPQ